METENNNILTYKIKRTSYNKINSKINKLKKILYTFIVLFFFFYLITAILIYILNLKQKNYILSNLTKEDLIKLKEELSDKISYLIKLKEQEKNSNLLNESLMIKTNEINDSVNNESIEFNELINEKFLEKQNFFCNNPNSTYNKEFEEKIEIVDIKYKNKKFNMFAFKYNDIVSSEIKHFKTYEEKCTNNMLNALNFFSNKKNVKTEDIYFIDVGANIGWYTFVLGKFGYNIISFEVSKLNNYILNKNYCLNKDVNTTLINKGLYNEEKKCKLMNIKINIGNNIVKCLPYNDNIDKKFEEITLTKLSNYIPFLSKRNLVLIKLDIEGSEANAIYGGIELITKYHVPFVFLEFTPISIKNNGINPRDFLQLFKDNGYNISRKSFFEDYISIDSISMEKQINLYFIYLKILE